jgi:hypothetical protein
VTAEFHLTEYAFTLHFLFQCFKCLVDIIVANYYLYDGQGLLLKNKNWAIRPFLFPERLGKEAGTYHMNLG